MLAVPVLKAAELGVTVKVPVLAAPLELGVCVNEPTASLPTMVLVVKLVPLAKDAYVLTPS